MLCSYYSSLLTFNLSQIAYDLIISWRNKNTQDRSFSENSITVSSSIVLRYLDLITSTSPSFAFTKIVLKFRSGGVIMTDENGPISPTG